MGMRFVYELNYFKFLELKFAKLRTFEFEIHTLIVYYPTATFKQPSSEKTVMMNTQ